MGLYDKRLYDIFSEIITHLLYLISQIWQPNMSSKSLMTSVSLCPCLILPSIEISF